MGLGNIGTSIVRTVTPIIVGALLTLLLAIGIELPADLQGELLTLIALVVTAAVQIAYYVVSRLVEERFPQFGFLLGIARTPDSYSPPLDTSGLSKEAPAPTPELSAAGLEANTTMYLSQYGESEADSRDGHTPKRSYYPDVHSSKLVATNVKHDTIGTLDLSHLKEKDAMPPRDGYTPKHARRGDPDVPPFPTQADLDAIDEERNK